MLAFSKPHGMPYTQNFKLIEHTFSVHPVKLLRYWSQASWVAIYETNVKSVCLSIQKH